MAKGGRINHPKDWPPVTALSELPNVSGAVTQSAFLDVGDCCFNTATELEYVCRVATVGSAVWYCPALAWDPMAVFPSYGNVKTLFTGPGCSDFLVGADGCAPFTQSASGTGATVNWAQPPVGRAGVISLETGTTAAGLAVIVSQASAFAFGSGEWRLRGDANNVTASDGTDTYISRIGFGDVTLGGDGVDGIFFRYTHSVNSGNWVCVTRSNNSETTTNTSVAGAPGTNVFQCFEIYVNAAGTSVSFYINGTNVATHTGTIPTGLGRETGVSVHIVKSAGLTNRGFRLDLLGVRHIRTTAI